VNKSFFQSKLISRDAKLKFYKAVIRPVVTYASETWVLRKNITQELLRFERKILMTMYGQVKSPDAAWRLQNNEELDTIIRKQNIVRQIKAKRLGWFGHVQKMEEHQITRKITKWMPTLLNMPKGRPKERWWDRVRGDLKIVGVLDWKKSVFDRKYWQGILEQAKTHPRL
jgi:hypothetical protein